MPMELTNEKPPGSKGELSDWFKYLSTIRGKGPQTMRQVAKHCKTTPANATAMLRPFVEPVGKVLSGTRWAETFRDSDLASIGDQWHAGKRWRKVPEEWKKQIEATITLQDKSTTATISADMRKAEFKGQTVIFGGLAIANLSAQILQSVKTADLNRIIEAIVQATLDDVPASETALSIFCLDTLTPWKKIMVLWSIQDGRLKTLFQEVSPEFYAALTSEGN